MTNIQHATPADTAKPIDVEHYIDNTPGDPYECVSLTIGDWQEDLTMGDAQALVESLSEVLNQPPPATPEGDN